MACAEGERIGAIEDRLVFISVSRNHSGNFYVVRSRGIKNYRATRKSWIVVSIQENSVQSVLVVLKTAHDSLFDKGEWVVIVDIANLAE